MSKGRGGGGRFVGEDNGNFRPFKKILEFLQQGCMERKKKVKILVYGIEKKRCETPEDFFVSDEIEIEFKPFYSDAKFYDYDGVILFQGIWAEWQTSRATYSIDCSKKHLVNKEEHELSKRAHELILLMKQGGFVVFLIERMDSDGYDLAKNVLDSYHSAYYKPIKDYPGVTAHVKFHELEEYFRLYGGVAKTHFSYYGEASFKALNNTETRTEGLAVCFGNQKYFLPYHSEAKSKLKMVELFALVSKSVVSLHKEFYQEVPEWVKEFKLVPEALLSENEVQLQTDLQLIRLELEELDQLKSILCSTGDRLREEVVLIFEKHFGFKIDGKDSKIEDFKILSSNEDESVLALGEVKGISNNVKNEEINQVDTHRERNALTETTPGILVVNTFRKAKNVSEKYMAVDDKQIAKAKQSNVLIIRTIDIMNTLNILFKDKERLPEFQQILLGSKGWLEVNSDSFILH